MTDDVDRVRGLGTPVTLTDGTETAMRFGMLGTRLLTKRYGSLNKLQQAMTEHLGKAAGSEQENDITDEGMELLLNLRAAALCHLGMDEFELDEALGNYGLITQMGMIFETFSEGLGSDDAKETAGPKGPKRPTSPSRSQRSGPSAPLKAVAQTSNSGT